MINQHLLDGESRHASSFSHLRPTRANFHEPSLCRFSTRMLLPSTVTGLSFADNL